MKDVITVAATANATVHEEKLNDHGSQSQKPTSRLILRTHAGHFDPTARQALVGTTHDSELASKKKR